MFGKAVNLVATYRYRGRLGLLFASLVYLWLPNSVEAQPREGYFLDVGAGLGVSIPDDDSNVSGIGFFGRAQYIVGASKWLGARAYGALAVTWPDETDPACETAGIRCRVTTTAALLGGTIRVAAPIPFVAPFLETGVGLSLGAFRTRTPEVDKRVTGAAFHLPLAFGLALGRDHDVEVAFLYYFHPALKQATGALGISMSFLLEPLPPRPAGGPPAPDDSKRPRSDHPCASAVRGDQGC